jgi:RecJ-like exonuclease
MSSFASRFKAGSDIAKDLLNTYETARRKKEFGEIAGAQEQADFTEEERAAMEAKANAVDANGQPIYTIGTDAQGNVTSTMNQEAVPGAVDEAYAPAAMARSGVKFMGKT